MDKHDSIIGVAIERLKAQVESIIQDAHHTAATELLATVQENLSTPHRMTMSVFSTLQGQHAALMKQVLDCVEASQREALHDVFDHVASQQPSAVDDLINLAFENYDGLINWMRDAESPPTSPDKVNGIRPMVDISRFKFFYDRPVDLPDWQQQQKMMFARMLNHMRLVPRANLCDGLCDKNSCKKSHTYLEVMRYNPLFKVLKCGKPEHYWAYEVKEPSCVCAHVDVNVDMQAMTEEKNHLCHFGTQCTIPRCRKSHSFAEVCWFNPLYKTRECTHGSRCTRDVGSCSFYHSESDRRDVRTEDDYVGKDAPILFIERTHIHLANALEALRARRASASS
ncbi:hypothetical protein ATCC90586_011037 [Pythium insidiosum]|nr:hypothetical protein ATCC90586_011037 [Pythium insidiosum]